MSGKKSASVKTNWKLLVNAAVLMTLVLAPGTSSAFPPQYVNALSRAEYRIFIGDVNGDGYLDVLAKAKTHIVMVDIDILIPITIKPPSPTFVLLSNAGGAYALDSNPSRTSINSLMWQANSHDLIFGDVLGNGSNSMLLRSRSGGAQSFLITTSASDGLPRFLEELSVARIGIDISGSNTIATLSDTNRDGRSDLVVRVNGLIALVLIADQNGLFTKPAVNQDKALAAWGGLCAALDSGDIVSAARFISPESQPKYISALANLGSSITGLTAGWSQPKAVEVVPDGYALYSIVDAANGGAVHTIVLEPSDEGWLISEF